MKPNVSIKIVATGTAAIFCVIGFFLIVIDKTIEGSETSGIGAITIFLGALIAMTPYLPDIIKAYQRRK